jgi:hypothetical protein
MRMGFSGSFADDDARRVKNDLDHRSIDKTQWILSIDDELTDTGGIWDGARGQTRAVENYQMRLMIPVLR